MKAAPERHSKSCFLVSTAILTKYVTFPVRSEPVPWVPSLDRNTPPFGVREEMSIELMTKAMNVAANDLAAGMMILATTSIEGRALGREEPRSEANPSTETVMIVTPAVPIPQRKASKPALHPPQPSQPRVEALEAAAGDNVNACAADGEASAADNINAAAAAICSEATKAARATAAAGVGKDDIGRRGGACNRGQV
ncbi:hypothetical protein F4802DRAFT_12103 [Xylaria palmicola]|nr:hypothetical protein F4802DRAFT_12103 [Xylaria palmicola]